VTIAISEKGRTLALLVIGTKVGLTSTSKNSKGSIIR
jgi:hypothetical protein